MYSPVWTQVFLYKSLVYKVVKIIRACFHDKAIKKNIAIKIN